LVAAGAAFAIITGAAAAFLLTRGGDNARPGAGIAFPRVVKIDPKTRDAKTAFAAEKDAVGVAAGAGSVWVIDKTGKVRRFDAGTGQTSTIQVARNPTAVTVGGNPPGVWVTTPASSSAAALWHIDPAGDTVAGSIGLPTPPSDLVAGGGAVWLVGAIEGDYGPSLYRVDLQTTGVRAVGAVTSQIAPAIGVAIGFGDLWVATRVPGSNPSIVQRVDPANGRRLASVTVGHVPVDVAAGEGAVWVLDQSGAVYRIDPTTNRVRTIGSGAESGSQIAVGEGAVWVTDRSGATVTSIDPRTNDAGDPIDVGGQVIGLAAGEGAVWVLTSRA
jgi:streptogramin lyase